MEIMRYERLPSSRSKARRETAQQTYRQRQTSGEAFEILFDLLSEIDREPDAIVFFADEGGSWQVGCDWNNILPGWFKCLSSVASPDDYAEKVVHIIDGFVHYDRDEYPETALREALVNAIAHRDYREAGVKMTFEVFHDRVVVTSSGLPAGGQSLTLIRSR